MPLDVLSGTVIRQSQCLQFCQVAHTSAFSDAALSNLLEQLRFSAQQISHSGCFRYPAMRSWRSTCATLQISSGQTRARCSILRAGSLQKGEPRQAAALYKAVVHGWPDLEFIFQLLADLLIWVGRNRPGARAKDCR